MLKAWQRCAARRTVHAVIDPMVRRGQWMLLCRGPRGTGRRQSGTVLVFRRNPPLHYSGSIPEQL